MERWLPVPGFDGYEVSSLGRVRSFRKSGRGLIVRGYSGPYGYENIKLMGATGRKTVKVHSLVLGAFAGDPCPGQQCRHLNGSRRDNRAENLQWGTSAENAADRKRHGTQARGEGHHRAKLNELQARIILRMAQSGRWLRREIAGPFGVCVSNVSQIKSGKNWSHLQGVV